MNLKVYYIAVMLFLTLPLRSLSQEKSLRFNHITAKDGLPNCKIIKMYTASNNVVWISTWEGLYYFDGKKIKKFFVPGHTNLFGGWTNYIVEGKSNTLYVGSVKGLLIINSKDLTAYAPPLYKLKDTFRPYYTEPLCEDRNNNLWLYTGFNTASLFKLNVKDTTLNLVINNINGVLSVIKNSATQSPTGIWYRENKGAFYLSVKESGTAITDSFFTGTPAIGPSLYINDIIARDTTEAWMATLQGLYYVNRQTGKYKICNLGAADQTDNIKSLAQRKNGLIYCATGNKGILVYNPVTDKIVAQYKHYDQDLWSIPGNNIEYIYIDDKDHLFAATANQSISYASFSDESQVYYKLLTKQNEPALSYNNRVTAVAMQKDFIYLYVEEKGLHIANKQLIIQKIIPNEYTGIINQLFPGNADTLWAATDKGLFYIFNNELTPVPVAEEQHTPRLYFLQFTSAKAIMAAGDEGIYFVETTHKNKLLKKYPVAPLIDYPFFTSLFEYKQGQFLLNTKHTSFYTAILQNDTIKLLKETHAIDIVPLIYKNLDDNEIIIGCTSGVYTYDTRQDLFVNKTEEKNQPYISFLSDKDKMYALSQNSLTIFEIGKKENSCTLTRMQNIIPGIYSSFVKSGGSGWVSGTSGGLVQFDLEKLPEPLYYVFNSMDNKKNVWHSLTVSDSLSLSLNDAKTFSVSTNNFSSSSANLYFKHDGQENWQIFANGEMVSVENLKAGWHTLAFNTFPVEKGSIYKTIFIPTPWYKKWWFTASQVTLAFLIIFFVVKRIFKNMQKTANTRQYIVETEMAALKAQMNPHFMFNCINSIDAFIHSNDKYNATLYLNKFAKLLRNILDSSKQNTVAFTKDIDTLKLYIELEELRHENKFKTIITIEDDLLSNDYKVPPLIIQPFVENAILHGLKNKPGNEGLLQISIKRVKATFEYTITDNGIGRDAAGKIAQSKESSYGMTISYDRIKLFNKEKEPSVSITDLYNELGIATGTSITVYLKLL
jgi:ligand-binding sensor domain-containing protein